MTSKKPDRCFSNKVNARCGINHSEDNWYCHNLCNYSKLDQWNNHIFSRYFPDNQLPMMLDTRPSFKWCMDTYITQPSGTLANVKDDLNTTNKLSVQDNIINNNPLKVLREADLKLNLDPYRNDRDCYFCRILNSLTPDRPDSLKYLRLMDVDSYVRGLTHFNSRCPENQLNANCINANLDKDLCPTCKSALEINPPLVQYIDRWNSYKNCSPLEKCYQIPKDTTDKTWTPRYFYGCPGKPTEFVWNNRTKTLDQYPKDKYCSNNFFAYQNKKTV